MSPGRRNETGVRDETHLTTHCNSGVQSVIFVSTLQCPIPTGFHKEGQRPLSIKWVFITERDPFLWELLFNTMGSKYSCPLLWRKHCHYVL